MIEKYLLNNNTKSSDNPGTVVGFLLGVMPAFIEGYPILCGFGAIMRLGSV
jgi:hypothetical protein